jgi:hypothetical protein
VPASSIAGLRSGSAGPGCRRRTSSGAQASRTLVCVGHGVRVANDAGTVSRVPAASGGLPRRFAARRRPRHRRKRCQSRPRYPHGHGVIRGHRVDDGAMSVSVAGKPQAPTLRSAFPGPPATHRPHGTAIQPRCDIGPRCGECGADVDDLHLVVGQTVLGSSRAAAANDRRDQRRVPQVCCSSSARRCCRTTSGRSWPRCRRRAPCSRCRVSGRSRGGGDVVGAFDRGAVTDQHAGACGFAHVIDVHRVGRESRFLYVCSVPQSVKYCSLISARAVSSPSQT